MGQEFVCLREYKDDILSILELIETYNSGVLYKRGFHIEEQIPKHKILFLDINPSCEDDAKELEEPFYSIKESDLLTGTSKEFFKKSIEISLENSSGNSIENNYAHHDVFFLREKNQNVIKKMLSSKNCKSFIEKALAFSEKIITEAEPLMIIASNAFVRDIFFNRQYKFLGFEPASKDNPALWNENLGVDMVRIKDKLVPVLFTGMLGSTGVIDNGSYFELKWHVRHILRHLNEVNE